MGKKKLAELLAGRLYIELQMFKDGILRQDKEAVYGASYQIELYVNLYEILRTHIGSLREETVRRLLKLNYGILDFLYQEWLTVEDSFFRELRDFICGELEILSAAGNPSCGKEEENGTELNQAA